MNYMLRILGPLAAFAVLFGLAYCTESVEEIYNRTDNFFVDTETEQSFEFQLNNYTDKPLMLVYQKREGEWNLGGIVPYSEGGGQCCVSIPRWYEGMTLPLTITVTLGADKFEYHQVNAKVDKFTDEDSGLLQFHVLPDYSVRVMVLKSTRNQPEHPLHSLYQSIKKDMDEYNQQHPLF